MNKVTLVKLCQWLGIPRRTADYRSTIKAMIEQNSSIGFRMMAHPLSLNKNTVQCIFQPKSRSVSTRALDLRPCIQALTSVARTPDERWAADPCAVRVDRGPRWLSLDGPGDRLLKPRAAGLTHEPRRRCSKIR